MKQIIPGVHYFTGLMVGRVYAIEDTDGLTLVDTGIASAPAKIIKQLAAVGKRPSDVKRILITHAHPDHVGGLPELKRLTGAEVVASAVEQPVIEGKMPIPRAPGRLRPPETRLEGTPVDRVVGEGEVLADVCGGLQVLFTPGHAPGHLCFWQPARGLLFCGDVLFNWPRLRLPFAMLTVDMAENRRSARRLAELGAAVVCFGHGEPLTTKTADTLLAFARTL